MYYGLIMQSPSSAGPTLETDQSRLGGLEEEVWKRLVNEQNSSSIKERKESKLAFALSKKAMLTDDA